MSKSPSTILFYRFCSVWLDDVYVAPLISDLSATSLLTVTSCLCHLEGQFRRTSVSALRILSQNTYIHYRRLLWQCILPIFLFQRWPKHLIKTASLHTFSWQTHGYTHPDYVIQERSFASQQIFQICAFHSYVNFRSKTAVY